jgi:hypothetical protein
VHLAVEVANAPLTDEQATRYVSRSRTHPVYEAATSEIVQLMRVVYGPKAEDPKAEDPKAEDPEALVPDWDVLCEDDDESSDPFDDQMSQREQELVLVEPGGASVRW